CCSRFKNDVSELVLRRSSRCELRYLRLQQLPLRFDVLPLPLIILKYLIRLLWRCGICCFQHVAQICVLRIEHDRVNEGCARVGGLDLSQSLFQRIQFRVEICDGLLLRAVRAAASGFESGSRLLNLQYQTVDLSYPISKLYCKIVLLLQVRLGDMQTGIYLDVKRRGVLLTVHRKSHAISTRRDSRSSTNLHDDNAGQRLWSVHAQIPYIAVHSSMRGQAACYVVSPAAAGVGSVRLLPCCGAGNVMQQIATGAQNVETDRARGSRAQIVVDDCSAGRILADHAAPASTATTAAVHANRAFRLVQICGQVRHLRVSLPQRSDVVQHPERASVCRGDQIIAMNPGVKYRSVRQI